MCLVNNFVYYNYYNNNYYVYMNLFSVYSFDMTVKG